MTISGDILLAINGTRLPAVEHGLEIMRPDDDPEGTMLRLNPGDEVCFRVIRTGTGELNLCGEAKPSEIGPWLPLLSSHKPIRRYRNQGYDEDGNLYWAERR